MGVRRRTRRRALVAGAAVGAGVAHHETKKHDAQQQDAYEQQQDAYDQGAADAADQAPAAAAPAVDPAGEIERLAALHSSGALTDEEFAAAKAKALGS